MSKSLTYVEIIVPQFSPDSPDQAQTFRFTTDVSYLPNSIDAIPSIKDVRVTPATISLGENLGQRASVEIIFRDHKHIFASESYDSGTFWGKFRARYGLKLFGRPLTVYRGELGDALTADVTTMEARTFIIESTDGPNTNGEYKIIAKDLLKLADGDKSQAPVLSNGFLLADITNVAVTLTLSPTGIGNTEYPASGYVNIGGNEIASFTRAGDVLTLGRGTFNTTAVAHDAQDRVQVCLVYTSQSPAVIINDLLVNYAGVSSSYISTANWAAEITAYLNTVYSAVITEPTDVSKLVSELIEQAGLVVWWDDVGQQVRLQVLHAIATTADEFDEDIMMAETLEVKEQPEKRLSQVYTYFGKINPTVNQDQVNNYRSTAFAIDESAEEQYGSAAIKKIYSRWIPDGGRSVADTLNDILLARFVTPPRRISFEVMRDAGAAPALGVGYQVSGWPFQDMTGAADMVPVQITRLNPGAATFQIEAEEMIFTGITIASPDQHNIIIDSALFDVNLRTMHDSIYSAAVSGTTVTCTILEGVIVGSTSAATPAFDVGTWAAGVTVQIVVVGRIQGKGGTGGAGCQISFGSATIPSAGSTGGTALYTRRAINLISTSGEIFGGGGGGGGGGGSTDSVSFAIGGAGGGGGAGSQGGVGGASGAGTNGPTGADGLAGTADAGGSGNQGGFAGGTGGGPGLTGSTGQSGGTRGGAVGGAAGSAIDGDSFVTDVGGVGDIRGGQVN